jgi:intraflagellar transport protein 88
MALFQQGDIGQAEKYGEMARQADSYNAAAFVNLGNCSLAQNDVEKAKELFSCALDSDASCVEALYNLGEEAVLLQQTIHSLIR